MHYSTQANAYMPRTCCTDPHRGVCRNIGSGVGHRDNDSCAVVAEAIAVDITVNATSACRAGPPTVNSNLVAILYAIRARSCKSRAECDRLILHCRPQRKQVKLQGATVQLRPCLWQAQARSAAPKCIHLRLVCFPTLIKHGIIMLPAHIVMHVRVRGTSRQMIPTSHRV